MASQTTDLADICLVCLESRPLKLVGKCKHRFCSKCLHNVFESKEGDVFACPTCKVDCLWPTDGVEGLGDYTGGDEEGDDTGVEEGSRDEEKDDGVGQGAADQGCEAGAECADTLLDARCKTCHLRKKQVQAVNLCVECGHLYICNTCTDKHSQNKATRGHVVVPLRTEKSEKKAICKPHDSLLNSYCHDCKKPVCMACVMWEHGEHHVEKLGDFVDRKVEALNRVTEGRARRLRELQHQMYELMALKGEAPLLDKQDVLIKEIEDHAEKCMAQIVKWKEDLKEQVKTDHKVIRDVPEDLEKVQKAVEQLQRPVARAVELLAKKEHHPLYLDKLVMMQQEVEAAADVGNDIKDSGHWRQLRELHDYDYHFNPGEMPSDLREIGKIRLDNSLKFDYHSVKEISKLTIQADSPDKFIPCVANLGSNFAVAHPTRQGEPSMAIDIYELSGTLKRTFRDQVPPLYDMSSTPDGKLAALSAGSGGNNCSVKLFDIESGYLSCTNDIDIPKPLSVGVTVLHQYAILGKNGHGETHISIADKVGVVLAECRCVIGDEIERYENPRLTCSRDFIVVGANKYVVIYQLSDTKLQSVNTLFYNGSLTDISATVWNDFFRAFKKERQVKLSKNSKDVYAWSWTYAGYTQVCDEEATGPDREARLSAKDGHIVVTHGCTIRVLKLL